MIGSLEKIAESLLGIVTVICLCFIWAWFLLLACAVAFFLFILVCGVMFWEFLRDQWNDLFRN
jgi:hypothetical protein